MHHPVCGLEPPAGPVDDATQKFLQQEGHKPPHNRACPHIPCYTHAVQPLQQATPAALQVVLPEGAFSIQADVPFAVVESRDTKYTYLDTAGRPVVVLKKQSMVPEHQQPFTVTYAFSRAKLLHEPALLVSSFAVLFASAMLWVRCDFRITKDEKWRRAREQEETTALLQRIAAVVAGGLCTASLETVQTCCSPLWQVGLAVC